MPRRPDTPCSRCGKLMWSGTTSLPAGERTCQPCRRTQPRPHGPRAGRVAEVQCQWCACKFTADRAARKFCSLQCANWGKDRPMPQFWGKSFRARAIRYGVRYEHVDRATVFERDCWYCQLCHTPIARWTDWPHPRSASLDHVVPMSLGGPHTYNNVWSAHLVCNIVKGARLDGLALRAA